MMQDHHRLASVLAAVRGAHEEAGLADIDVVGGQTSVHGGARRGG